MGSCVSSTALEGVVLVFCPSLACGGPWGPVIFVAFVGGSRPWVFQRFCCVGAGVARAAWFSNGISFCLLHSVIFVDLSNMTIF